MLKRHAASPGETVFFIRHFTLIELLVVIAIIAILAGMLLPALGQAKKMGMKARCVSNLKQQGVAFNMYAVDFKGMWPAPNTEAASNPESNGYYLLRSCRYVKELSFLDCPGDTTRIKGKHFRGWSPFYEGNRSYSIEERAGHYSSDNRKWHMREYHG